MDFEHNCTVDNAVRWGYRWWVASGFVHYYRSLEFIKLFLSSSKRQLRFTGRCNVCWAVLYIPPATETPSFFEVISRLFPGYYLPSWTLANILQWTSGSHCYFDQFNKKLSYCCDSRSYCMQYLNAIHCDRNISTSELKKNPFAVSLRIQQLLRICVRNPQSAQAAVARQAQSHVHGTVSLLTNEPTPMHTCSLNPHRHLWRFSNFLTSFFCG